MSPREPTFHEAHPWSRPIRDLGLTIAGSPLEPILAEFETELQRVGIRRVRPHFYLTTEWVADDETVAVGIPFYLARPDLLALHAERAGHVEGSSRADILRYLRHEMGHVVSYAYKLFETEEWIKHFGAITQPYLEEYFPEPFSRRFVRHLPGWYAQKHPDEDWAETFAVWMTPGLDWRAQYADWPEALAKLDYCDRTMAELADRDPLINASDPREPEVGTITYSVDDYYSRLTGSQDVFPPGLDGALRTIFEDFGHPESAPTESPRKPASALINRLAPDLSDAVFRWTGHFPERTRPLLRHLAELADQLGQVYPEDREDHAVVELTCLVTTLALNYVRHKSYMP